MGSVSWEALGVTYEDVRPVIAKNITEFMRRNKAAWRGSGCGDEDDCWGLAHEAFMEAVASFDRDAGATFDAGRNKNRKRQFETWLWINVRRKLLDTLTRALARQQAVKRQLVMPRLKLPKGSMPAALAYNGRPDDLEQASLTDFVPQREQPVFDLPGLLVKMLTEDAKSLVKIVLVDSPREVVTASRPRSALKRRLRRKGWTESRIRESFADVALALS